MLKINDNIYGIAKNVYYRWYANAQGLMYSIYIKRMEIRLRGTAASIWEKLISKTIYTDYDEVTIKNLEYFKSKGWIKEYENEEFRYMKMPYVIVREVDGQYYMANTLFNTVSRISEQVYTAIIKDELSKLDEKITDELLKHSALTITDCHTVYTDLFIQDSYYTVYIILNYACNMDCVYCFEGNEKVSSIMDELTLTQMFKYIDNLVAQKKVEIVFYGGEPLLEKNKMQIIKIMNRYEKESQIYFRFITNGLNVSSYMDVFEQYKNKITRFVITIDGVKRIHDQKRIRHDKSGTYDDIIKSIKMLTDSDYHVTVRINIGKDSIHSQIDSIKALYNRINRTDNIDISIHVIHYRYNADYAEPSLLDLYRLQQALNNNSKIVFTFSHPFLEFCNNSLNEVEEYPRISDGRCMYNNTRVIDINGDIYKCSEAMKEKGLCIGNVASIDKVRNDLDYLECKKNGECKKCDYYLVCYGKCSIQNYIDSMKKGCVCDIDKINEALDEFISFNS
jgi:radical SAM protein with 4Fe4S-binding SPASM domain